MLSDSLFDNIHKLEQDIQHYFDDDTIMTEGINKGQFVFDYDPETIWLIRQQLERLKLVQTLIDVGYGGPDIMEEFYKRYSK